MKLSARLTLSYLVLVLLGMSIVTPLAWIAVERLYLDTQTRSLLAQAAELAGSVSEGQDVLNGQAGPPGQLPPYSQAYNTLPGVHSHVIGSQGALLIDLLGQPLTLNDPFLAVSDPAGIVTTEELLARPEVVQAFSGKPSSAVRKVAAAGGRRVLYAAAPVHGDEAAVSQIVYLATPLPDTRWSVLPMATQAQFIAVMMGAVLLAWAAGRLLAQRIVRPLSAFSNAAEAVAEGDLHQAVPEDSGIVELAALGKVFNQMTDSLRRSEQAKNAFIADVNHELRTPLTVIKGTIETLQDGAIDDVEVRDSFLDAMGGETDRLIRLVNDLLILTRADAGSLNLRIESLDLAELARQRCQHFQPAAGEHQVALTVQADPERSWMVPGDTDRLSQVLDNLLDNAIRYAPHKTTVQVVLKHEGERINCQVSDQGSGIPAEHLPFIFERFYRVDSARDRRQGGSGLGLAIVHGLVQAHGGGVQASSLGQGTTITFWLPALPSS